MLDQSKRAAALGFVGLLLRWLLWASPLQPIAARSMQFSTPLTSASKLREGVFWVQSGQSPYTDGGNVVHQPPALLFAHTFMNEGGGTPPTSGFCSFAIISLVDLAAAGAVYRIARSAQALKLTAASESLPRSLMALYLFNPQIVGPCVAGSTAAYNSAAILMSIAFALEGRCVLSLLGLSVATYLSVYPCMLLVPVVFMLLDGSASHERSYRPSALAMVWVIFFLALLALLFIASYGMLGSWDFARTCYYTLFFLRDLTPTIGLYQPLFVALLPRHRDFFMLVVQVHMFSYMIPLGVRFRRRPLFMAALLLQLIGLLKTYPCTADVGIGICLMGVNGQIVAGMRHKWLIALLFGWSHIMIEHAVYLWLFEGSSGYNYYYFNSLLGCMAQVGMITTSFGSALHIEAKQDSEATKKRT